MRLLSADRYLYEAVADILIRFLDHHPVGEQARRVDHDLSHRRHMEDQRGVIRCDQQQIK